MRQNWTALNKDQLIETPFEKLIDELEQARSEQQNIV